MLSKAIAIASKAFEGKNDKGGKPYILHCLRVMFAVAHYGEIVMIIAILHDLVEDTDWTFEQLCKEGFSDEIIKSLMLLTHDKSVPYENYIKGISTDKNATIVKKEDLKDNSDLLRIKGIGKKDFDRVEKYHKAFLYLDRI